MLDATIRNKALAENEREANRQMSIVCAVMAVGLIPILVLYFTGVFITKIPVAVYTAIIVSILLLLTPLIWMRTKKIEKPGYKYFLLGVSVLVVTTMNVLLPMHTLLAYGVLIILTNHYYNPRHGRIMFVVTIIAMLLSMYGAMFVGEYEPDFLTEGKIIYDELTGDYVVYQPASPQERWEFLFDLAKQGDNRFAKVFLYYYVPRALILSFLFSAADALNRRTLRLVLNAADYERSQERISTELGLARELQRESLAEAYHLDKDVEVLAQLSPAKEVGGDFYDYFPVGEGKLAVLIGDVSGKGVPSAMFMIRSLTLFRAYARLGLSPLETVRKVNEALCLRNEESMFVTVFFGILDEETGEFVYVNAGHNPPILGRGGRHSLLPCSTGFLLGGMEECLCEEEKIVLSPKDSLTLYTDGVTEARNNSGEFYGDKRMISFFNSHKDASIIELCREWEDDIYTFASGQEQADDITYLRLVYRGEKIRFKEGSFPASPEGTAEALAFLRECGEEAHLTEKVIHDFTVCVDEIYSNIVKYGELSEGALVHVRCQIHLERNIASVTFVDHGKAFDPTQIKETTMDERGKDAAPGGLGILMIHHLMSEVAYHRVNGKNVLIISKRMS